MAQAKSTQDRWLQADPAFRAFGKIYPFECGGWEYEPAADEVDITDIAPTAVGTSEDVYEGTESGDEISDINALRRETSTLWKKDEHFLPSLQEDLAFWAEHNVAVDADRMLRCALRANLLDVAEYLMNDLGATIMSRDVLDRTALTYAVSMQAHSKVLDFVLDKIDDAAIFDREVQHQDVYGNDAAFYAAIGQNLPALLVRCSDGARSKISQNTIDRMQYLGVSLTGQKFALLSFGYLEKYLNFPVYVQHNAYENERELSSLFTVADLHRYPSELDLYFGTKRFSPSIPNSLIWMHMPWTNSVLLDVFYTCVRAYLNTRVPGTASIQVEHEACRRIFHQSWMKAALAPGNMYLNYRLPTCEFFDNTAGVGLDSGGDEQEAADEKRVPMRSAVIVFPYMSLGKISNFKRIRQRHIESCQPFHSSGIHTERTLDEEHYPSLSREVLDEYNADQVTSRECKRTVQNDAVEGDERPLLIVSQLWIWRFGNYLISAMTPVGYSPDDLLLEHGNTRIKQYLEAVDKPEEYIDDELASPVNRLISEMRDEADAWRNATIGFESRARGHEVDTQIGSLLAMQVEQFGKLQVNNTFQTPLDYYEIGVARVMSEVNEYTKYSRPEALDIDKEKRFVHEISDIRGELMMVDEVLSQQQELLETFFKGAEPSATSHRFWGRVIAVQQQLAGYRRRVAKIVRDAEHIDSIVNGALDLKRTHASIQDARASLQDARSSLLLGWAVMGFTVITVVFAPIAFMTALLALPIDNLLQNQKSATNAAGDSVSAYPSGYVTWTFFVAEIGALVLTALAIWAALKFRDWIKPASAQENEAMGKATSAKDDTLVHGDTASQHSLDTEKASLRRRRQRPIKPGKEEV